MGLGDKFVDSYLKLRRAHYLDYTSQLTAWEMQAYLEERVILYRYSEYLSTLQLTQSLDGESLPFNRCEKSKAWDGK